MAETKRPKDMTDEERAALPVGPIQKIDGKPVHRDTMATYWLPDDILCWSDSEGRSWLFGQFRDGAWFKKPFAL